MLAFTTHYAIPAGLFVLMLIVGTDLKVSDFTRALQYPAAVLSATLGQLLLLPLLALLITRLLHLEASLSAAIFVLALCPGGAISNYYCYLANCNVALSVTMTAVSTLGSLVSIPGWLLLAQVDAILATDTAPIPVTTIVAQLAAFMALPLGIGMVFHRWMDGRLARWRSTLQWISLTIVLLVLLSAIWTVRGSLAAGLGTILPAAVLFTLGAMVLGLILAHSVRTGHGPVIVIEFAVRGSTRRQRAARPDRQEGCRASGRSHRGSRRSRYHYRDCGPFSVLPGFED